MNAFLTRRGIWLLVVAVAFWLVGALASDPVIVLLGHVPVVVLVVSALLCLPAAMTLDRRLVQVRARPRGVDAGVGVSAHAVDEPVGVDLEVTNHSPATLYGFTATPYVTDRNVTDRNVTDRNSGEQAAPVRLAAALGPARPATVASASASASADGGIDPGAHQAASLELRFVRPGRWSLQGFDVTISDPLGLVHNSDYLPCIHVFECYPRMGRRRRGRVRPELAHAVERHGRKTRPPSASGTDVRELRDYQAGDPLRNIAWKATVRNRRLIAREFDQEVSRSTTIVLDISSTMRGGERPGQKLQHAIELATAHAEALVAANERVGLLTFDDKIYGHVPAGASRGHLRRLLHHLIALDSVVDAELTELDESELELLLVDYLLVQERLDFRRGHDLDPQTGINRALLHRWLQSVLPGERRRHGSAVLREGMLGAPTSLAREFLQLRGVRIPYRAEARLGLKERGLAGALEHLVTRSRQRQHLLVISDLCAVANPDLVVRAVELARLRGHSVEFVVPFAPAYYARAAGDETPRFKAVRELFTTAESEERRRIVERIRALGVSVEVIGPR